MFGEEESSGNRCRFQAKNPNLTMRPVQQWLLNPLERNETSNLMQIVKAEHMWELRGNVSITLRESTTENVRVLCTVSIADMVLVSKRLP